MTLCVFLVAIKFIKQSVEKSHIWQHWEEWSTLRYISCAVGDVSFSLGLNSGVLSPLSPLCLCAKKRGRIGWWWWWWCGP